MIQRIAVALALGVFLAGCSNSPESMCKKMAALEEKAGKDKADDKKAAECVKNMTEFKEKEPAKYECWAKCADQPDADKAKSCVIECAKAAGSAAPKK